MAASILPCPAATAEAHIAAESVTSYGDTGTAVDAAGALLTAAVFLSARIACSLQADDARVGQTATSVEARTRCVVTLGVGLGEPNLSDSQPFRFHKAILAVLLALAAVQ